MVDHTNISRDTRHSVMLSTTVERFGKFAATVHRLRNLSARGGCIATAAHFRVGETVVVHVGSLAGVAATVRWVDTDLAGLMFASFIDLDAALANAAIKPPAPVTKVFPTKPAIEDGHRSVADTSPSHTFTLPR